MKEDRQHPRRHCGVVEFHVFARRKKDPQTGEAGMHRDAQGQSVTAVDPLNQFQFHVTQDERMDMEFANERERVKKEVPTATGKAGKPLVVFG